jgi:protein-tyrosine phosphatase
MRKQVTKLKAQKKSGSKRINRKQFTVLFVCSGNSCRSPMAKGIFDKLVKDDPRKIVDITSLSAGTSAINGQLPTENAQKAVLKYEADIKHHLSAQLTKERIKMADLILAMEQKHKDIILELYPRAKDKTYVITNYISKSTEGIIDPLGHSLEIYQATADKLHRLLERIYKKINNNWR